MPKDRNGKVEFSALVPESEYKMFRERFPGYGAVNWFINACLTNFNNRLSEHPELKEEVERSIEALWNLNRIKA